MIVLPLVVAQEITQEDIQKAGILPDNPFYGIKIIVQRIIGIFGEKYQIRFAEQRLTEIKVMVASNKITNIERPIIEFNDIYSKIKNKERLKEHKKIIDNLGQRISTIVSIPKGDLTLEQKAELRQQVINLITEHKDKILNESIKNYEELRR